MSGEDPSVTFPEKDQLSQKDLEKGKRTERRSRIKQIRPQYLPQATLQYRTFLKRSIVEALQNAFNLYNDPTLAKAKIGIDYQTARANFPCIVVKYNERSLKNMGVAHEEWANASFLAEQKAEGVTLNKATGEATDIASTVDLLPGETKVKGQGVPTGTFVKEILDEHSILLSQHPLKDGITTLTFTPVESDKFIPFHHYIYNGDISLEIYGESSADRDRMSDAVVEVVAMGTVGQEGATFQERLYATVEASQYPYSGFHFIAVNTDIMKNQGEAEELAPWMVEDVWLYKTGYSFEIMGEFYSIVPETPETELGLVDKVDLHPYHEQHLDEEHPDILPVGEGDKVYTLLPPDAYPQGEIPPEDYIPIIKRKRGKLPSLRKYQDMTSAVGIHASLAPRKL